MKPLKEVAHASTAILQPEEIEEVFANIEDIYVFHQQLLQSFEERMNGFSSGSLMADIMVQKVNIAPNSYLSLADSVFFLISLIIALFL